MLGKPAKAREIRYPEELDLVERAAALLKSKTALATRCGVQLSAVSQWGARRKIPRAQRREVLRVIEEGESAPRSIEGRAHELMRAFAQVRRLWQTPDWKGFQAFLDSYEEESKP